MGSAHGSILFCYYSSYFSFKMLNFYLYIHFSRVLVVLKEYYVSADKW